MTSVCYCFFDTPFDQLLLIGSGEALTGLYVAGHERCPQPDDNWSKDDTPFQSAFRQLDDYFAGHRKHFDLEVELHGTPFQRAVWREISAIPYGQTASYGDLAVRVGRPGAARAVGAATGRNPVSVIVPCHRVMGADGSLTGYGWGTDRKVWLLEHEGILS